MLAAVDSCSAIRGEDRGISSIQMPVSMPADSLVSSETVLALRVLALALAGAAVAFVGINAEGSCSI